MLEDEELLVLDLLNVKERCDVRVVEDRERHRLLDKALADPFGGKQIRREELQRDEAVQLKIERLVHLAHPTRSEELFHLVVEDGLANHRYLRGGCSRWSVSEATRRGRQLAPDTLLFQAAGPKRSARWRSSARGPGSLQSRQPCAESHSRKL